MEAKANSLELMHLLTNMTRLTTEVTVLTAAVREMSVENAGYARYDWRPLVRFIESDPEVLEKYMNFGFPKEQMEAIGKLGPVMGRIAQDGLILSEPPLHIQHAGSFARTELRGEVDKREEAERNKQNPMKAGSFDRYNSFDIGSEQHAEEQIAAHVKKHEKIKRGKKNGKAT